MLIGAGPIALGPYGQGMIGHESAGMLSGT
jgi:hypothetical protein